MKYLCTYTCLIICCVAQVFENEIASMLCKTMKGIERPSLAQLNQTIVSNICPIFLPKSTSTGKGGFRHSLIDDITHLCAHPGYPFLDVKVTPQTSNQSVDFTCDSWSTLLKTIQQMQLSGSASERGIKGHLKHALQVADHSSQSSIGNNRGTVISSPVSPLSNLTHSMNQKAYIGGTSGNSTLPSKSTGSSSGPRSPVETSRRVSHSYASPLGRTSFATEPSHHHMSSADCVVRSLASVVTLHGTEAPAQAAQLQRSYDHTRTGLGLASDTSRSDIDRGAPYGKSGIIPESGEKSGSGKRLTAAQILQQQQLQAELQLHELYIQSHSPLLSACSGGRYPTSAVNICASEVPLNGYQRATSAVANSQAILPLLQRAVRGGAELYEAGAYLHQYSMYGIEEEDFQHAFRSLGSSVQNYMNL